MANLILHDAGNAVHVCRPAPRMMRALTQGGFGKLPGDAVTIDLPDQSMRLAVSKEMPTARAIDNMVRSGFSADFAGRWLGAVLAGGETDASALEMVRHKTFPHAAGQVAATPDVVPADRFFRNAWRLNGTAIEVDLEHARVLFARRFLQAKNDAVKWISSRLEELLLLGGKDDALDAQCEAFKSINLRAFGDRVLAAQSVDALRALWPSDLDQYREVAEAARP